MIVECAECGTEYDTELGDYCPQCHSADCSYDSDQFSEDDGYSYEEME